MACKRKEERMQKVLSALPVKPCKHPCCPDQGPCRKVKKAKPRKAIAKVSKAERKRQAKYRTHRKKTFDEGENICEVALLPDKTEEVIKLFKDCQYWATQLHHPAGRTGNHLLDKGVKLCGICHNIVEEHPILAKQLGLSKSRLIKT